LTFKWRTKGAAFFREEVLQNPSDSSRFSYDRAEGAALLQAFLGVGGEQAHTLGAFCKLAPAPALARNVLVAVV
jgi:hypothetical protein